MSWEDLHRCLACGSSLSAGERRCPNGHEIDPAEETAYLDPDEKGGPATVAVGSSVGGGLSVGGGPPVGAGSSVEAGSSQIDFGIPNRLFECQLCARLVEVQYYEQRAIVPRFCPWCGKPVSTLIGRELDGYEINSVLAEGGFGSVCLASNLAEPKMKAVIKLLRPHFAYHRPELIRVFVEEARLTEEIGRTCWNVVRVSNVREKPWPYFFMEYLRGKSLTGVIREALPESLPIEDCAGYLRGIAKALAATHARGRVHRDLKPMNIMVVQDPEVPAPEDRIKLLDFGLSLKIATGKVGMRPANYTEAPGAESSTPGASAIRAAGTPEYMAPEAFDGLNDFTGDIYAFGVTAYEVLTGKIPWGDIPSGASRFFYWREAHRSKEPEPVRQVRPEVPGWLGKVVMACLEKDPKARIQTAEELLSRLRQPWPLWVWLAGAAMLALVATLATLAFLNRGEARVAEWIVKDPQGKEETFRNPNPLHVWVKSPKDLPTLGILATAGTGRPVLECSSHEEGVECTVEKDGNVRVRFDEDPPFASQLELYAVKVPIAGRGADFRLEGEIWVGLHPTGLDLTQLGCVIEGSGPPRVCALPERRSFHPKKVQFVVSVKGSIEEQYPRRVVFRVSPVDGQQRPATIAIRGTRAPKLEGEAEAFPKGTLWRFPLADLSAGDYVGRVEAVDDAGNVEPEEPGLEVRFATDDKVSISLLSSGGKPNFLARKQAFYEFKVDEPLGSLEVSARAAEKEAGPATPRPFAIYESEARSELELSKELEELKPLGGSESEDRSYLASLEKGEKGQSYLLAIPVDAETAARFVLTARDLATPENDKALELSFQPPSPLGQDDIAKVSLKLEGETERLEMRLTGPEAPAGATDDSAAEIVLESPRPVGSSRLERLEVTLKQPGRIHRATCRLDGTEKAVDVDDKSLIVENLELKASPEAASTRNAVLLEALDPLDRRLRLKLTVLTDLRKPRVTFHSSSKGRSGSNERKDPPHHESTSGKDIRLWVEADEPLAKATCSLRGQQLPDGRPREGSKRRLFDFDLGGLSLKEGSHPLKVEVADLAGNKATVPGEETVIHIDPGGPRIVALGKEGAGRELDLKGDNLLLEVTDDNGLKPGTGLAVFRWTALGKPTEEKRELKPPKDGTSSIHSVSLDFLPDDCTGTVEVSIADTFGIPNNREAWNFRFRRAASWKSPVRWKGVDWILVPRSGGRDFFVSRTEISNRLYALGVRSGRVPRPKYWGADGGFPVHFSEGKPVGDAGSFPVVGVTPEDAESLGKALFGARIPTYEEWRATAWKENQGGRYPWPAKDEKTAKDYCNTDRVWESPTSPFKEHHYDSNIRAGDGTSVVCRVVAVDFDPLEGAPGRLGYSGEILHLIGNVGELVRLSEASDADKAPMEGSYGIAGGDFFTPYEKIDVRQPLKYEGRPNARTGFRLVIDPGQAHPAFLREARQVDKTDHEGEAR